MEGDTRRLARFVVGSHPADIPAPVIHEGKRALLHWLGCSIGGSQHEAMRRALAGLQGFSGIGQASVLGRHERLDPMLAALMNGISADILGFSDTHLATVIHPGGVVGPAVLALAERSLVRGDALLHAFVLGIEVACRVGRCVHPWHYGRGWHITGTAGVFGAAAAAGKLLGLDEQRMVWALGLAATQAAGLREMFGTMSKSFTTGRAAQNGLLSAVLAAADFTSSNQPIEGRRGFAHVLGDAPDLPALTARLGERFEILENTYKPFPCGIVIHPVADGCIRLHAAESATFKTMGAVDQVVLRVHPLVLELTGNREPADTAQAKLSVFHSAAAALATGRLTEQEYGADFLGQPLARALRDRIMVVTTPSMREDEADISVQLSDGRTLRHHVDHAIGSTARPMRDDELAEKVHGLADPVLDTGSVQRLIDACWSATELEDAAILARLAVPSRPRPARPFD